MSGKVKNNHSHGTEESLVKSDPLQKPETQKGLLSPVDRISETLYGVIMTLTFTCTMKIAVADDTTVKDMMVAAIGCNIAWGIVDGVMFVMAANSEKGHSLMILRFIQQTKNPSQAIDVISEELPSTIAETLKPDDLEGIRKGLLKVPIPKRKMGVKSSDIFTAAGIFVYVFISTFPVVIPFAYMHDDRRALRTSNGVAIVMMFICGWILGRYAGGRPWITGVAMSLIGILLVLIAIMMGG
jgi:VIT1/CCC1 family predicted Fe2+/Mn2+ transporter